MMKNKEEMKKKCGLVAQAVKALASHRWGPEFASRSLHVGFMVEETGSG